MAIDLDKLAAEAAEKQDQELPEDAPLAEHLRELIDARERLRQAEEIAKELRSRYDYLRKKQLPDLLNEAGVRSFKLPTGESCYLQGDLHVSVKKEDRRELHEWLRDRGLGDLIQETVHYQTLRAAMRERKEQGKDLPPFVGYHPYEKVNVRTK